MAEPKKACHAPRRAGGGPSLARLARLLRTALGDAAWNRARPRAVEHVGVGEVEADAARRGEPHEWSSRLLSSTRAVLRMVLVGAGAHDRRAGLAGGQEDGEDTLIANKIRFALVQMVPFLVRSHAPARVRRVARVPVDAGAVERRQEPLVGGPAPGRPPGLRGLITPRFPDCILDSSTEYAYVLLVQAPLCGANGSEAFSGSLVSPPAITVSCGARETCWWPLLGTETGT